MPLVLRVDVDKPYGRANLREKVFSKLSENYGLPAISFFGYLHHVREFLAFLSEENIKAHLYFRKCTLPPKQWLEDSIMWVHKIGHHAENTQNFETFKEELEEVQNYFSPIKITSFTKHGSGNWKGGRYHYPLYEPQKYLKWAKMLDVTFLFGNEEVCDESGFEQTNSFYPGMFWVDRFLGDEEIHNFQWIINSARTRNVIIIIHPANFIADKRVDMNMRKLVLLSRQEGIPWLTL